MSVTVRQPMVEALRVVEVDPLTEPRWTPFVASRPDGLVYHHPAWMKTLEREYGRRPIGLACEGPDGRLHGVLALLATRGLPFQVSSQLGGRRLSSLPRTPVAGPLAIDREAGAALLRAAVARARAKPGLQLQLKTAAPQLDGMVENLERTPWRQTYVLDLTENPREHRFGDGRAHRRNSWAVNKATRLGVHVRPAETTGELQAWYLLYLETMRGLAVPPRPYRFFRAAWDILCPLGLMQLLVAEQQIQGRSRLLAGSLYLMFGRTVFYAFTGWRRADHALRANDLIHWQAIQDAWRRGFHHYDFGEVAGGQRSLAAFKSKWGGEERPLYRYVYPAPARTEAIPLQSGRLGGLAGSLWRRLPLRATAQLGDGIYHFL